MVSETKLQEKDSNPRPPGYGPGELPLLYPAIVVHLMAYIK